MPTELPEDLTPVEPCLTVLTVKGEEMVECLVSPLREPSEFLAGFEELEKAAWYLHHTPEGRYYFDRQELCR